MGTAEINSIAGEIAVQVAQILQSQMVVPEFAESPVPIGVVQNVLGMCPDQIRNKMEEGILDIGTISVVKHRGKRAYRSTYISPKKFFELTGYIWSPEKAATYRAANKKQA